jgi:membrane protein implicated in regulation of membrane protease activity
VFWLVVLTAVLVAHGGLSAVFLPFLGDAAWVYDLAFLLLALPPVVAIAGYLYASLDPGAEAVADRVVESADTPPASDDESDCERSGPTSDE